MSVLADIEQASFRGVPFEVDNASERGGQRLAVHSYPLKDGAEVEPLGQGERRFSIDGFVIGATYRAARDRLVAALEQGGPGELVHPWRGRLQVFVEDWSCEENKRYGGCAEFRLQFLRDDSVELPRASVDTQDAVATAADQALVSSAEQFQDAYLVATAGDRLYSLQAVEDLLQPLAKVTQEVRILADRTQLDLLTQLLDPVAGARSILTNLVGLPGELSQRIQGFVRNLTNAADLSELFDRGSGVHLPPGRASSNGAALLQLQRTALVVQQATVASQTDYASYDEAMATQARISEQIDTLAYEADDATVIALQDLRAAVATDLKARGADLARITHYTPAETLPALVIANRLYGPAGVDARAEDLLRRNRVVHPGFVSGGRKLEVLTP